MFTATLRCGAVLSYEVRTFRPVCGDLVPCRHHGYCIVHRTGGPASGGASSTRARPRSQNEFRDWLRGQSETTVHVLRRQGFTLRMVAAAERDGLVNLDLRAGRVAVRPATGAARRGTDEKPRSRLSSPAADAARRSRPAASGSREENPGGPLGDAGSLASC